MTSIFTENSCSLGGRHNAGLIRAPHLAALELKCYRPTEARHYSRSMRDKTERFCDVI